MGRRPELRPAVGPDGSDLLERCCFPSPGTEVVCGVSGGADSFALLVLATAAGLDVTAVHVDHGLREDSHTEAAVVEDAAERLGARFRSERVVVDPGANLEQRARNARLGVLGPSVMLGHTADDAAETLLINLIRGAGPEGLGALRPGSRHPILALRRAETEHVCATVGLDPITDPSNDDPSFVRNRVRHELLPLLGDIAGRDTVPLLERTASHSRALVDGVRALYGDLDPTDTRMLRAAPLVVATQAVRDWLRDSAGHPPSTAEFERAWSVVELRTRACELSGGRRLRRTNGRLFLEPGTGGRAREGIGSVR